MQANRYAARLRPGGGLVRTGTSSRRLAPVVVRRRVVAALVVAIVVLGGAARAVAAFGAGPASGTERRPAVHIVEAGESLWSIATALRPNADTTKVVHTLMKLNGGSQIQVGQRLILPDG